LFAAGEPFVERWRRHERYAFWFWSEQDRRRGRIDGDCLRYPLLCWYVALIHECGVAAIRAHANVHSSWSFECCWLR
jgi:hypothetical protein